MIHFYVTFCPNEAGYFGFKDPFQIIKKLPSSAKPQLKLCWLAELALISVNPAPPPGKVYLVAVAN